MLAVLFPMLVLISTATRLAAARREERFAAMRLVGATPGEISVIASVDSVVGALFGAVAGIGVFPASGPRWPTRRWPAPVLRRHVTPTAWGYLAVLVRCRRRRPSRRWLSLRRVQISPLGVSRRATPPPPSAWRLPRWRAGVALFVRGCSRPTTRRSASPAYPAC